MTNKKKTYTKHISIPKKYNLRLQNETKTKLLQIFKTNKNNNKNKSETKNIIRQKKYANKLLPLSENFDG